MKHILTARRLIWAIGIYSCCVVGLISCVILTSPESKSHEKAIIRMALGLILFWIVISGFLMYRFREILADFVRGIGMDWRLKFVLFATTLALAEEAITVTMTNLAPLFGAEVGKAFITASANYLHTVLFHSVIVFIPMFVTWAFLLNRYNFRASSVFLLFGLTGSIAEMSMQPTNVLAGFWFFVYGLMVFLPALSVPPAEERSVREPKLQHFFLAAILPLLSPVMLLPLVPLLRLLYAWMDPVFFVDSPFGA